MNGVKGVPQLQARLKAIGDTKGLLTLLQVGTVQEAKRLVPRKTGNLGRSIVPGRVSATSAYVDANAKYAAFVEDGTGIYGPRKRKIVPVRASVLAWRTGGSSSVRLSGRSRVIGGKEQAGWAFAQSVRGRPATPFLIPGAKNAVSRAKLGDIVVKKWNGAA